MLLLAVDIEYNPGPTSKLQEEQLASVLVFVKKIETGKKTMLSRIKKLEANQKQTEATIKFLEERVSLLENNQVSTTSSNSVQLENDVHRDILVSPLQPNVDKFENRSRRNNVILYRIKDTSERESWLDSEKLIIELCESKLAAEWSASPEHND